ncbi:MAG: IclR family transcriptional regulator [Granulosicoccaceae bacterium]
MSTVSKAIDLLSWFSTERAEIGLAEFQRLTSRDKATTYRYLRSLEASGLLEQNPVTRTYRMGPAVLRFAHVREATVPRRAGVRMVLPQLADATGELAHASILESYTLVPLSDHASTRYSARVVLSEPELPLHATGSGLAALAFGEPSLLKATHRKLKRYTNNTATNPKELDAILQIVRATGFGVADQAYEEGVYGIGVPLFDSSNTVAGAVAVASVATRINDETIAIIKSELVAASRQITHSWGGEIPEALDQLWSNTLNSLSSDSLTLRESIA